MKYCISHCILFPHGKNFESCVSVTTQSVFNIVPISLYILLLPKIDHSIYWPLISSPFSNQNVPECVLYFFYFMEMPFLCILFHSLATLSSYNILFIVILALYGSYLCVMLCFIWDCKCFKGRYLFFIILLLIHTHSSFHTNHGLINICRTKFVRWLVPDTVSGCEWWKIIRVIRKWTYSFWIKAVFPPSMLPANICIPWSLMYNLFQPPNHLFLVTHLNT